MTPRNRIYIQEHIQQLFGKWFFHSSITSTGLTQANPKTRLYA